jgi:hypothetical protein
MAALAFFARGLARYQLSTIVVVSMVTVATVHEQMKDRTQQDQQIWKSPQHVNHMCDSQVERRERCG